MAGNVQIGDGLVKRRRRRRKRRGIRAGAVFFLVLAGGILTAAALTRLDSPYDFSERNAFYALGQTDTAVPFAHNLCVPSQETIWEEELEAEAAAVFDLSDKEVIVGKNLYETLYPASITKTMTALLAIKYGNLDDMVTVTEEAVITEPGSTLCGIKPGDQLTMEQLLYGLMIPSGNDAGAAIAVHMDGSIEAFAQRMNEEAKRLGATQTHFVNPHGLPDENHYTTAYDLYLIFNEALKYPQFREIIGTKSYTADYRGTNGQKVSRTWEAGNWYMTGQDSMPDALTPLGGKTGTTKAAGNCLIMGSRDFAGSEYISVILKAPNRQKLYDNMDEILDKIVD
ncbi:MAG TPA: serine hydrolase [Candidatus Hungatella pullicola]|nr:serine hydrolase [Candidatus Hungatella pullicola]